MKERPILFSGPMIRALLDGRKTQTRRVVKPQPVFDPDRGDWAWKGKLGELWTFDPGRGLPERPYGAPGDRLWVRETWAAPPGSTEPRDVAFSADHPEPRSVPWRPSIHMPRWASRITLELTAVRVERLQDISEADAIAEGMPHEWVPSPGLKVPNLVAHMKPDPRVEFEILWDSLNAKRAPKHIRRRPVRGKPVDRYEEAHREEPPGPYAWASNPWVWVLELKRVGT